MAKFPLHTSSIFGPDQWLAGWTDSTGPEFGSESSAEGRTSAVAELVEASELQAGAWAKQVHGSTILRVLEPGLAGEADGLWTDTPGLGVIGISADCPLILVGGRRPDHSQVCGFAHASWRSTVQGIAGKLVSELVKAGTVPSTLAAILCPSAGPCCYEVGPEVREKAIRKLGSDAGQFFRPSTDRWILDLWSANAAQLTASGISSDAIAIARECTICGPTRYPSYRREGALAGRFAAIIGFRRILSA